MAIQQHWEQCEGQKAHVEKDVIRHVYKVTFWDTFGIYARQKT